MLHPKTLTFGISQQEQGLVISPPVAATHGGEYAARWLEEMRPELLALGFRVIRALGEGGMGKVLLAEDMEVPSCPSEVALKVSQTFDSTQWTRLEAEFSKLVDFLHPNVARLYKLKMIPGSPPLCCISMQLVAGKTFSAWWLAARGERTGRVNVLNAEEATPLTRLRAVLRQIAEGVSALHAAGIVHGDLKPGNLLVRSDDSVAIVDFGLATLLEGDSASHRSRVFGGTPVYASPEQVLGEALPQSDWYSFGVLLFRALTGVLPFDQITSSREWSELRLRQERLEPETLLPHLASCPPDLAELCLALMHPDPLCRPTADEVSRVLGASPPTCLRSSRPAALIGREAELAALSSAQEGAAYARMFVRIHGDYGTGKSELIQYFINRMARDSLIVFQHSCNHDDYTPFKVIRHLVLDIVRYLEGLYYSEVQLLKPNGVADLTALFPELRGVKENAWDNTEQSTQADWRSYAEPALRSLAQLLERIGEQRRELVTLFIDDLQWGDAGGVEMLGMLISAFRRNGLLVIAAYCSDERNTSPALRKLTQLAEAGALGEVRDIEVGPLSPDNAQLMLRQQLQFDAAWSEAELLRVCTEARGNPAVLLLLAAQILRTGGQDRDRISLENAIRSNITDMPASRRRLLELAALAGRPLALEVLVAAARLSGVDTGDWQFDISELKGLRLIRIRYAVATTPHSSEPITSLPATTGKGGGTSVWLDAEERLIDTANDHVRQLVVSTLDKDARILCFRCLAQTLEAHHVADAGLLYHYFVKAKDRESAARMAGRAARWLMLEGDFTNAIRFCRRALLLGKNNDLERIQLRVLLGEAIGRSGRSARAAQVFLALAEELQGVSRFDILQRAVEHHLYAGEVEAAIALLKSCASELGLKFPLTSAGALVRYVQLRAKIWQRGQDFTPCAEERIDERTLLLIDGYYALTRGFAFVDPWRAAGFQLQHLILALDAGEPYRVACGIASKAGFIAASGKGLPGRITDLLTQARNYIRTQAPKGDHQITPVQAEHSGANQRFLLARDSRLTAEAVVGMVRVLSASLEGRWQDAITSWAEEETMLTRECRDFAWERKTATFWMLLALRYQGHWSAFDPRMALALRSAEADGDLFLQALLRFGASYFAHLRDDQPEEAYSVLSPERTPWLTEGFYVQNFFRVIAQAEVELYRDNAAAADEILEANRTAVKEWHYLELQISRILWHSIHGRVALRLATTQQADRKKLLKRARREANNLTKENTAWGRGLAALQEAGAAALEGKPGAVAGSLREALECFQATSAQMRLHTAVVQDCLEAHQSAHLGGSRLPSLPRLTALAVQNPSRMVGLLAPGLM